MAKKQYRPLVAPPLAPKQTNIWRKNASAPRRKNSGRTRPRSIINKSLVIITTYNRPDKILRVLEQLEEEKDKIHVRIYDDCSTEDYSRVRASAIRNGWQFMSFNANHGKRGFWKMINSIFADVRAGKTYKYYYMLQDDVILCNNFIQRSSALWDSIRDGKKISLLLLRDSRGDNGRSIWTNQRITSQKYVSRIQFIDFPAFICSRDFFEAIGWAIKPITPLRWRERPELSTGVGEQLSHRLNNLGLSMYRSNQSYILHDHERSMLNPLARNNNPLEAKFFVDDLVTASLASIPSRKKALQQVVASLLPQVDFLNVYLNNYKKIPAFLDNPKITVARSSDHGNIGDIGKFFWSDVVSGFHFTCDDDILYPSDYVSRMVQKLHYYDNKAVVGCHGVVLADKIQSYYKSRNTVHFKRSLKNDKPVHILGTGTVAYHTSAIAVRPDNFKIKNMADIWFAIQGQKQRVPFVAISRPANWLTPVESVGDDSIFTSSRKGTGDKKDTGERQTAAVQSIGQWNIYRP